MATPEAHAGPGVISDEESTAIATATVISAFDSAANFSSLDQIDSSTSPTHLSSLHTHRQHHNSSKLPTLRSTDLRSAHNQPGSIALTRDNLDPGSTTRDLNPAHQISLQQKQPNAVNLSQDTTSAISATIHHHPTSKPSTCSPHSITTSKYQTASISVPLTPTSAKPSASSPIQLPTTSAADHQIGPQHNAPSQFQLQSPSYSTPTSRPRPRRAHTSESPSTSHSARWRGARATTKEWAQGLRELSQPKAAESEISDDNIPRRKSTISSRPPLTYRPSIVPANSGRPVIPPIRSFRSSGSRKTFQLDMNNPVLRSYDDGDDSQDPDSRDRSLRALEGRRTSTEFTMSPDNDDDETMKTLESENTADIFMKFAGGGGFFTRRGPDGRTEQEPNGAAARVVRTARQRPLSFASSPFRNASPPRISRRLSDQQETARTTRDAEEQPAQYMPRELAYRTSTKDKAASTLDDSQVQSTVSSLRPSPITPRAFGFHNRSSGVPSTKHSRKSSFSDNPPRSSSNKHSYSHSKSYNSSPLVPRRADSQHPSGATQGAEGTESSDSTAAPSTVWDELDDLKSRIHRLELTGKLPKTSGAAMSRVSDERPPTAGTTGTNATTMSGSPKQRSSGQSVVQADVSSIASSQRESQPILISALSKSKPFVSSEVYSAMEAAATDALALSQMMGTVGQPGPISSGASAIGNGGIGTVTDRQLRRKAESICRSLTELCLALGEEAGQRQPATTPATSTEEEKEPANSPPRLKVFTAGLGSQRGGSTVADQPIPSIETTNSSRATRLEKKAPMYNFTGFTGISSPRYPRTPSVAPSITSSLTPTITVDGSTSSRKTSLVVARTRRAGTEEPGDFGRKSSLLRTRRAGTEEPGEARKPSLLLHSRRKANNVKDEDEVEDEDEDESRFRLPSRAVTDLGVLRAAQDTEHTQGSIQDLTTGSSILPRRRVTSRLVAPSPTTASSINGPLTAPLSRRRFFDRPTPDRDNISVVTPSPTTASSLSGRRYLDRSAPDRDTSSVVGASPTTPSSLAGRRYFDRLAPDRDTNSVAEKLAEVRGQRQLSLGQTAMLNRTSSISSRRLSGIPSISGASSQTGAYR